MSAGVAAVAPRAVPCTHLAQEGLRLAHIGNRRTHFAVSAFGGKPSQLTKRFFTSAVGTKWASERALGDLRFQGQADYERSGGDVCFGPERTTPITVPNDL